METQVRTPQAVFMQPQRLVVPLFQRPYVWNEEQQWEPLWNDVVRAAERLLKAPTAKHQPHFLGAVVLQQVLKPVGLMQERTVIDGQQRLTTLQLMLDALRCELLVIGAGAPAARLASLVENAEPFRSKPQDRFKVSPTNRDQQAFTAAMSGEPASIGQPSRLREAHQFFREQAADWMQSGDPAVRGEAIETAVRDLLQVVVIDLGADENAQEIFETLNARGAILTAADLVKNFVFQRLQEQGADVDQAYQTYWRDFETGFWETEISAGRLKYQRSSAFINHWLVSATGEEVVAREVFNRFKRYAIHDSNEPMPKLLGRLHQCAGLYRSFVQSAQPAAGSIDRVGLFAYRTGVLESEVVKPLLLHLLDPALPPIESAQLNKALSVVEGWMVRRMLVRATSKSYTQIVAEMITILDADQRARAGDALEQFLVGQRSASRYWPDDSEVIEQLQTLVAYRVVGRGRLRMLLEACEDHLRGWSDGKQGLGGERVARGAYAIEHIMPRKWEHHWQVPAGSEGAQSRNRLVHTIGNLTLLTAKLNSKLSNGPWLGAGGKRETLHAHDVLVLNRRVLDTATAEWSEDLIRLRSRALAELVTEVWPVPTGHRTDFGSVKATAKRKLRIVDLINAGVLHAGMQLYARPKSHKDRVVLLLADGSVEVDGSAFASPSLAAAGLTGHPTNGWSFFLVEQTPKRSLRAVRRDYLESMAVESDEDDDEGEDDDEDS